MAPIDFDAVHRRARADLALATSRGDVDLFLWEHSCRVAESARVISRLPEAAARSPDEAAVYVAGLYHDAGWAIRCKGGEIDRMEILLSPTSESSCDQAATLLEKNLAAILPATTLETASRAVRMRIERNLNFIEAEVLCEAEHLEEFGLLPLWTQVRRGLLDGKGVQAVLDGWKRKQEYQFWRARLGDSFRFDAVRELARQRLASIERFMSDLESQHCGHDVLQLAGRTDSQGQLRIR